MLEPAIDALEPLVHPLELLVHFTEAAFDRSRAMTSASSSASRPSNGLLYVLGSSLY